MSVWITKLSKGCLRVLLQEKCESFVLWIKENYLILWQLIFVMLTKRSLALWIHKSTILIPSLLFFFIVNIFPTLSSIDLLCFTFSDLLAELFRKKQCKIWNISSFQAQWPQQTFNFKHKLQLTLLLLQSMEKFPYWNKVHTYSRKEKFLVKSLVEMSKLATDRKLN